MEELIRVEEVNDPGVIDNAIKPTLHDYWQQLAQGKQSTIATSLNDNIRFQIEQEIMKFFSEGLKPRPAPPAIPQDPITYWKSNSHVFPNLAAVARRFLSTPPSSVDSERLFSTAGAICTDKRSRLSASKSAMLLFNKMGLDALNFNY